MDVLAVLTVDFRILVTKEVHSQAVAASSSFPQQPLWRTELTVDFQVHSPAAAVSSGSPQQRLLQTVLRVDFRTVATVDAQSWSLTVSAAPAQQLHAEPQLWQTDQPMAESSLPVFDHHELPADATCHRAHRGGCLET